MMCFRWLGVLAETEDMMKKRRKQRNEPTTSAAGKHNKNVTLNKWSEKNVQAAINKYKAQDVATKHKNSVSQFGCCLNSC